MPRGSRGAAGIAERPDSVLPARFARYDRLIDALVDEVVREIERGAETDAPTGTAIPAGAMEERQHGHSRTTADSVATA